MIDPSDNRSVFFVVPYPIGNAPSQRFRFEQYFDALRRHQVRFDHQSFWQVTAWAILFKKGHALEKFLGFLLGAMRRVFLLFRLHRYEFVFIHREAMPVGPPVFEWIVSKVLRRKIIYDFDDAIWLANTSEENVVAAGIKWHSKVRQICRWSHTVSAGNEFLASFARPCCSRVVINPTTVDTNMMKRMATPTTRENGNQVTIGWTGSHSTLKYLKLVEPSLVSLEKEFPTRVQYVVIADRSPMLQLKNLRFIPWSNEREVEDLLLLDIGIMPLEDDAWAKGKCGLKALQYMAMAIPTVASPVGVNTKIVDDGITGYLCDSPESWEIQLRKLILDAALRRQLGEAARKRVVADYSTTSNESTFLSLFA